MKKRQVSQNDLIEILMKKASGYFYQEEVYEYEKTQNKDKSYMKSVDFSPNSKNFKKSVTVSPNQISLYDMIETSNGKDSKTEEDESQNLTLSKKKITTHYVPPDMLAIKILFEITREKVGDNDINKMSDEELINLKNKLLEEINEDK